MVRQFCVHTQAQGLVEVTRLVPECDPFYRHDTEGPDDMPAHITWQGVYLWEHRHRGGERELVLHIGT